MGYRGTVNTLLNFGERGDGAVGWLVGGEHRGLAAMFHMMNEARVGVGMGAAALGVTGYLHSLEYAGTRTQGRAVGGRDVTSPMIAISQHSDVKRMLLAQKSYAEAGMALGLYCSRLVDEKDTAPDDEARARAALLLDVLTPIAKSWPSQWCLAANDLAIQVLGGSGYTRDFPVEQFYRDNRLNPIHEGTHGIQAIDLLGRKAVMRDGAGLDLLLTTIRATIARAGEHGEYTAALEAALRPDREDHRDPARRRRPRRHPRQRERLPRGRRARRRGVDLARAAPGADRPGRLVRRRQARRRRGTSSASSCPRTGPAVRPARLARHHHARLDGRLSRRHAAVVSSSQRA